MGVDSLPTESLEPRKIFITEFTSPEQYAVANGLLTPGLNGPVQSGFFARVVRLDLPLLRIKTGEASNPVSMVGGIPETHAFTFSTRSSAPRVLSGREITEDILFHPRPNDLLHGSSPSGRPWPWATVTIDYETMARDGAGLAGKLISPPRNDIAMVRADPAARLRLIDLIRDATRVAENRPEIIHAPNAARAISGSIMEALVNCLMQGAFEYDRAAVRRHRHIMRRLEDLLSARPQQVLTLPEICASVGVAQRSLQLICREFTGLGVTQYARAMRMRDVRRVLATAIPGETTVAAVAMQYGFWELGRFALAYKTLFGEAPSATLRRLP